MTQLKKLSATFVKKVRSLGTWIDRHQHGLALKARRTKIRGLSKTWIQHLEIDGKVTTLKLGTYPKVTLDEARRRARKNSETVKEDRHPTTRSQPTFQEAAERVIELHSYSWQPGGGTLKRWEYNLSRFVYPRLGMKWVGKVTSADLVACLAPIWHTKPETARQVLSHIRAVMQWAEGKGYRSDDPTRVVSAALGPIRTVVRHLPAVHHSQVSQVLRIIEASNAYWATKAAFRFMTYTAARNGMVRGARWEEIDFASATWTVPGERVKSGRAFTVPLSHPAYTLLEQTWQHTGGVGLVFPSPTGRPLSDGSLSKLCRENNVGCVPDGMRSSFRDWCAETGVPNHIAEQALAHTPRGLRATGIRTDLLVARGMVMEMWAIYLTGTTSPN